MCAGNFDELLTVLADKLLHRRRIGKLINTTTDGAFYFEYTLDPGCFRFHQMRALP
jgi:hypothetical protein